MMIDICPECKGVWLERGELDKLLEIAGDEDDRLPERSDDRDRDRRSDDARPRSSDDSRDRRRDDDDRRPESAGYKPEGAGYKKKKSSWLSQILEVAGGEGGD